MSAQSTSSPLRSSAAPAPRSSANPNLAAALTWLLPGAGHAYMGKAGFGLAAFCVVQGLYLLGYKLTDGMLLEVLQPELRTRFAPALTPEAGNLGATIWHMKFAQPFGPTPYRPSPFPSTMVIGMALTALSGVANIVLCVRAWCDAAFSSEERKRIFPPAVAVGLTWVLPGLGHFLQGRKLRGAIIAFFLVGLFLIGTMLAQGANLDREMHFYYASGQFLVGLPAMIGQLVYGGSRVTSEIPYLDGGLVLGCVAGLLNILAMMDAFTCAELPLVEEEDASNEVAESLSA